MPGGKRIELCSAGDVAPGAAIKVEIDDLALAVFNVEGEYLRHRRYVHPRARIAVGGLHRG